MDWQKLDHATMRHPLFARARCRALGAHLRLLVYLGDQEIEDGTIPACLDWKPRDWRAVCNLSLSEVRAVVDAGLACFTAAGDLLVLGFDAGAAGIRAMAAKRAQGPAGAQGGRPPRDPKPLPPPMGSDQETQSRPDEIRPEGKETAEAVPAPLGSISGPTDLPQAVPVPVQAVVEPDQRQAVPVLDLLAAAGAAFIEPDRPAWLALLDAHGTETVQTSITAILAEGGTPRASAIGKHLATVAKQTEDQAKADRQRQVEIDRAAEAKRHRDRILADEAAALDRLDEIQAAIREKPEKLIRVLGQTTVDRIMAGTCSGRDAVSALMLLRLGASKDKAA